MRLVLTSAPGRLVIGMRKPNTTCHKCGKGIYRRPHELEKRSHVYCSRDCYLGGSLDVRQCEQCGSSFEPDSRKQRFCSRGCSGQSQRSTGSGKYVSQTRRKHKQILVTEAGGCCQRCGYDRCVAALQFHHRDRNTKLFDVSRSSKALDVKRVEAAKCDLLCANCHVEVEMERLALVS